MKSKIGNKIYDWKKLKGKSGIDSTGREYLVVVVKSAESGNVVVLRIKELINENTIAGCRDEKSFYKNDEDAIVGVLYQLHNWYGIKFEPEIELEKITTIKKLKEVVEELNKRNPEAKNDGDIINFSIGFFEDSPCVMAETLILMGGITAITKPLYYSNLENLGYKIEIE